VQQAGFTPEQPAPHLARMSLHALLQGSVQQAWLAPGQFASHLAAGLLQLLLQGSFGGQQP
jgi:hypothetical protein